MQNTMSSCQAFIGNTPSIEIPSGHEKVKIFAKLENLNPTGSIKDRLVDYIIKHAHLNGLLKGRQVLVEASSGNTASSVAYFAKRNNLKAVLFVPQKTSVEKVKLAEYLGAKVNLVSESIPYHGISDYCEAARYFHDSNPESFFVDQYNSNLNSESHYYGIGQEIISQVAYNIDYFVAVGSTGGTISGAGKRIKERWPKAKIILADPYGSVYFSSFKKRACPRHIEPLTIEGAGKKSIAKNMDFNLIDDVYQFENEDAISCATSLFVEQGIFVGYTSGAAFSIAKRIANQSKTSKELNILTIFPDSGFKYLKKLE